MTRFFLDLQWTIPLCFHLAASKNLQATSRLPGYRSTEQTAEPGPCGAVRKVYTCLESQLGTFCQYQVSFAKRHMHALNIKARQQASSSRFLVWSSGTCFAEAKISCQTCCSCNTSTCCQGRSDRAQHTQHRCIMWRV